VNFKEGILQIAPMVDWTNSPFRFMMRLLMPKAKLFTEMIVPRAIIHAPDRHLDFYGEEHPLVLQLGGSDSDTLIKASLMAQNMGYDEINLNLGCPSERVQAGAFGACLMKDKQLVVNCLQRLNEALNIPVTAKTRIGVDDCDSYAFFEDFVGGLVDAGCQEIIIHARKALLKGLNPKQNRTIPPIQYDFVYRIQETFPQIRFIVNGDIKTTEQIERHLQKVHGVMLGRLACDNPYYLTKIHQMLYPDIEVLSREQIVESYLSKILNENIPNQRISLFLKPLFNLYHGTMVAKIWKQLIQQAMLQKQLKIIVDGFAEKIA
jgi:tRNA-dihydrouridine synthase A